METFNMSFVTANILHEPNFGLPDEYISKIIAIEKMKETTERFTEKIKPLCEKFGNVSRIRVAVFDKNSVLIHSLKQFSMRSSLRKEMLGMWDPCQTKNAASCFYRTQTESK
jgi:hypothetical protein